jgi:uncharacterized membrane protein
MPDNQKPSPGSSPEPELSLEDQERSEQPRPKPQSQTQASGALQTPLHVGVALPGTLLAGASQPGAFTGVSAVQTHQTLQVWQGTYPPPDAIERYEKVLPGSFDRILRMAEQLQTAQIDAGHDAQQALGRTTRRGHWLGWSIAIIAMGAALLALWLGNAWVAGLFVGIPVMTIAKALIDTTKSRPSAEQLTAPATTSQPTNPTAAPDKPG